jgi:Domain of unknown function (DUF4126)
VTAFGVLHTVGLAIALAACAGLRAWLPLLLAGGLARMELLQLGSQFGFLSSNKALALLGLATVIEIAADKIPALDHGLDAISTVLRPAAGTLLAASVLGRISDPMTAWVLGTSVGAPAALVPHVAKSGLRVASSAFTLGLANPLVSLAEDGVTLALFALALVVPLLICTLLILTALLIARRLARRPSLAT